MNNSTIENPVKNGILFIHGYNVKIKIQSSHLVIDYVRFHPQTGKRENIYHRLNRATSGLKRLVISGDDGYISLYALRWLAEIKTGIYQIGYDNQLYLASIPPGYDNPGLRRYQVLAAFDPIGIEIIKTLLYEKIKGQIHNIKLLEINSDVLTNESLEAIQQTNEIDQILYIEAATSKDYWQAWKDVPLTFPRQDLKHLPNHWLTFNKRRSELGGKPKNASNPANAMLNYLYAILKGETTLALQSVGLDPGMGLLHSDNPGTPNLALDVMEATRPEIDRWFLSFLQNRIFSRKEFFEQPDGSVRLAAHLRQELSGIGTTAFQLAAPWVEFLVHTLEKSFTGKVSLPSSLTQANRKHGRKAYRIKETKQQTKTKIENKCLNCGKPAQGRNTYCSDCWPEEQKRINDNLAHSGVKKLAKLRKLGINPAHGGTAAEKRSSSQKIRAAARIKWEEHNPGKLESEKERFVKEIQPLLYQFTISQIKNACKCSPSYASMIKKGEYVPHPVFNSNLERLIFGDKP